MATVAAIDPGEQLGEHQHREAVEFGEPNSERSRDVTLPAWTIEVLKNHRKEQLERRLFLGEGWQDVDLVIDRGDGAPVTPDSISRRFRDRLIAKGLAPVRFHDLRHAHATLLLADGYPLKAISDRLGALDDRDHRRSLRARYSRTRVRGGASP